MQDCLTSMLTATPFAYGGIHDNIDTAENTIPALQHAASEGMSIAVDIRRCQDGSIVLFRDRNTHRMTNRNQRVASMTYGELSAMPLYATGGTAPLLTEALSATQGIVPIMLVVHEDGNVDGLMNCLIATMEGYNGKYCIVTASVKITDWLIANHPDILHGTLVEYKRIYLPFFRRWTINTRRALASSPNFVCCEITALPNRKIIKYFAKNQDAILLGWGVASDELYDKARTLSHNIVYENIILKLKPHD